MFPLISLGKDKRRRLQMHFSRLETSKETLLPLAVIAWLFFLCAPAGSAKFIEQPRASYSMDVRLDADAKIVRGKQILTWYNHSDEPVGELQFHLYLNAFRNNQSSFLRERRPGEPPARRRWVGGEEKWGWTEVDRLTAAGHELTSAIEFIQLDDNNAADRTVFRVVLPEPVPPRGTVRVEMEFRSKLPRILARTGFVDDFYFVAQWFPKIGVWEAAGERGRQRAGQQAGWNCHQFHAWTEFYADYGTYDVRITVPQQLVVGATGVERSRRVNGDGTASYHFYQEDVHDFAWTAQPDFVRETRDFLADREVSSHEVAHWSRLLGLLHDEVRLSNVRVTLLLQPEHRRQMERHFRAAFRAIKYFGLWYGRYPYETLTVVDPPRGGARAGGMEYPTLMTAGTRRLAPNYVLSPEGVIVHEFGHQFWYGLVANNEFEEAWLDEGLTSYSTGKVLETAYGPNHTFHRLLGIPIPGYAWFGLPVPAFPWVRVEELPLGIFGRAVPKAYPTRRDAFLREATADVMHRRGWEYRDRESYRVNAYAKPELMLRTLEGLLGEETMARVMRTYHQRFRFHHPSTDDFVQTASEVAGRDLKWYFDQVIHGSGALDYAVEVSTRRVPQPEGIFTQGGRHVWKEAGEGEGLYENLVTVRRLGEVIFPVRLLVEFENGERVTEEWDGQYRWQRYSYLRPYKIGRAQIDPEKQVWLDVNFLNNSAVDPPDRRPAQKWYLKWVFWLQNLFLAVSFFA